jgi:hypothetical protein
MIMIDTGILKPLLWQRCVALTVESAILTLVPAHEINDKLFKGANIKYIMMPDDAS